MARSKTSTFEDQSEWRVAREVKVVGYIMVDSVLKMMGLERKIVDDCRQWRRSIDDHCCESRWNKLNQIHLSM